eukprot:CAMPEP_0170435776 /NCGR_PEP_ID=MMETSP0117_2-20130122/43783_1 /TAXON_ID=400756 /ORGANISM="Durinskia baltica, Strain CSIRO CS-38" /LENGTH=150 /DNA_ID=CAMNT_0010695757 /DNA_START=251 /DNA_END=702 /DNA_ORIENTATION=+
MYQAIACVHGPATSSQGLRVHLGHLAAHRAASLALPVPCRVQAPLPRGEQTATDDGSALAREQHRAVAILAQSACCLAQDGTGALACFGQAEKRANDLHTEAMARELDDVGGAQQLGDQGALRRTLIETQRPLDQLCSTPVTGETLHVRR